MMKKMNVLALVFLFVVCFAVPAKAIPIWFDADAGGSEYSPILIDELHGEVTTTFSVQQELGPDGILNNGDHFTESFTLGILKGNLGGAGQILYDWEGTPLAPELYANLNGIGGVVINYNNGGDGDTTAYDIPKIFNDTWDITYTPGEGDVQFWYDNPIGTPDTQLATFEIVDGGFDNFVWDNDTLTADIGIDLVATYVHPGVWFLDNGGSPGPDVATLSPSLVFLALADSSVNLLNFRGGDSDGVPPSGSGPAAGDYILIDVDDNGTDVEFDVVPEPASMLLLGSGLLGLAGIGRRRFRKKD